MPALASSATDEWFPTPSPALMPVSPLRSGELAFLDRVINDCEHAHELAVVELRDSVLEFREAFGRRDPSAKLLTLARQVHYALACVRHVEAALRRLVAERTELIRDARPQQAA